MIPSRHNNSYVRFEKPTKVTGQYNDTIVWVKYTDAWVSITPQRGREVFSANELEAVVTHKIRGDFLELEGIDETMRMVFHKAMVYDPNPLDDSDVYNILAYMPDLDSRADVLISAIKEARNYGQQG